MLNKKEIKDIQSLSHKKFRDQLNLFVAEGPKVVGELLELVPGSFEKIYARQEWLQQNEDGVQGIDVAEVSELELERISQQKTPHDVLAVLRQWPASIPESFSFALYLDTIQDPGNLGTIIRIADWFGVNDVVCSAGCADLYNIKVVQSTMASLARVNVYYDEEGTWLRQQHSTLYAAALEGTSIYQLEKKDQGILLIGNESKGLNPALMDLATEKITIPRRGGAESLNAAVATGIILSHLVM